MKIFQPQATCMYGKKIYFSTVGGIVDETYSDDTEYCYHDFIEIELYSEGEGVHYMNAIPYDVKPGYFFLLLPGDYHRYALNINTSFFIYNIKIDSHYMDKEIMQTLMEMQRPFAVYLSNGVLKKIEDEMQLLQKMCMATKRNEIFIKNIAERIVILLIEEISKKGSFVSENYEGINSAQMQNIRNVISYVEKHYAKNLTAEKMAEIINVTPQYFSNFFVNGTGMTFKKFLTRVRLYNATILLETTNLTVKEIAYRVGFSSQTYFSRVFTRFFGKSPQAYKNQNKE